MVATNDTALRQNKAQGKIDLTYIILATRIL